jgi:plasmid stabilization system protein ParE
MTTEWECTPRQAKLGRRFVAALDKCLAGISSHPERWPEVEPGVREARIPRWPFCVYYQTHSDHVLVIAVFHTSRDPGEWQSRI